MNDPNYGVFARLLFGLILLAGCSLENPGLDPPANRLNFPIAIALSGDLGGDPGPDFLYLANSNFDLRYNAGSVQAIDLGLAAAMFEPYDACDPVDCIVPTDSPGVIASEVLVGSYAAGLAVSADGTRLFLPIRSDSNLTYIDVLDGGRTLSCGGSGRHECAGSFRRGDEASASDRGVELPADPVGIVTGPLARDFPMSGLTQGDYVILAHSSGRASLFLDRAAGTAAAPVLVHVVDELPRNIVNIAFDPLTGVAWLASATERRIGRVGVALEQRGDPSRSFLFDAGALGLGSIDTGGGTGDVRAVEFDTKGRAFVLSRRPEALLISERREPSGSLDVDAIVEVGSGPSRLDLATVAGRDLAFVSCFDTRDLYVIDIELREIVGVVRGLSGPFELAVDPARNRVYVADFRASVIRVIALDPLVACLSGATMGADGRECSPIVIGSIGVPRPVEELQ